MTQLCEAFSLPRGVTAVVGGGGKTSLIGRLCRELEESARVLRLTTTHIRRPEGLCLLDPDKESLRRALGEHGTVTIGSEAGMGKLKAPQVPLEPLFALADYVLIEADGSRGLPLKAPAEHEPVLTGLESLVIAVAGMTGAQAPIAQAAHRPERYARLVGKAAKDTATPEDIALVLESREGQRKNVVCRYAVLLNQCDSSPRLAAGRACAALLRETCVLAALQTDPSWVEVWRKEIC